MTTREDLETELLAQLEVADNSTTFSADRLTSLIKNAYIWATQIAPWNDLVRAKKTRTQADHEYYDYPSEFASESIVRMMIDGEKYVRRNYEDYLDYKERNPNTQKKMFASFGRQFFVNPTPTTTGTDNIVVWGSIQADALSLSTSIPIFSYNKEEANQAVIGKALSVAVKRSDPNLSQREEQNATVILMRLFKLEQDKTQRNKRLDHPFFNVYDLFGNNIRTDNPIGRFNYLTSEGEDD